MFKPTSFPRSNTPSSYLLPSASNKSEAEKEREELEKLQALIKPHTGFSMVFRGTTLALDNKNNIITTWSILGPWRQSAKDILKKQLLEKLNLALPEINHNNFVNANKLNTENLKTHINTYNTFSNATQIKISSSDDLYEAWKRFLRPGIDGSRKELGAGGCGTVWKITDGQNSYALKQENEPRSEKIFHVISENGVTPEEIKVNKAWRNGAFVAEKIAKIPGVAAPKLLLLEIQNAKDSNKNGFYQVPINEVKEFLKGTIAGYTGKTININNVDTNAEVALHGQIIELAPGKPLSHWVKKRPGQPLDQKYQKALVKQLLKFHAGCFRENIVHRDLKPDNIMMEERVESKTGKEQIEVKIIDLDFSHKLARAGKEKPEGVSNPKHFDNKNKGFQGTRAFMDPRIFQGTVACGPETDVFSTIKVILEACLGVDPTQNNHGLFNKSQINGRNLYDLPNSYDDFKKRLVNNEKLPYLQQRQEATKALKQLNTNPWLEKTLQGLWPIAKGGYNYDQLTTNADQLNTLADSIDPPTDTAIV